MTIKEASEKYIISPNTLKEYETYGLLKKHFDNGENGEYCEADFKQLGLIRVLLDAGFTFQETKKYIELTEGSNRDEKQIYMLRKQRRELLNEIHEKQKVLDQLDFIIHEKKKQGEKL